MPSWKMSQVTLGRARHHFMDCPIPFALCSLKSFLRLVLYIWVFLGMLKMSSAFPGEYPGEKLSPSTGFSPIWTWVKDSNWTAFKQGVWCHLMERVWCIVPSRAGPRYIEGMWVTTRISCVSSHVQWRREQPLGDPRFASRPPWFSATASLSHSALAFLMSYTGTGIFHRGWIKCILQKVLLSPFTSCRRWWVHHHPCWAILIPSKPLCWEGASDFMMKVVAFAPSLSERSECLLPADNFSVSVQSHQILSLSPLCHDKYLFLLKSYSVSLAAQLWLLLAAPFWNPSAIFMSFMVMDVAQKLIPLDKMRKRGGVWSCGDRMWIKMFFGYGLSWLRLGRWLDQTWHPIQPAFLCLYPTILV